MTKCCGSSRARSCFLHNDWYCQPEPWAVCTQPLLGQQLGLFIEEEMPMQRGAAWVSVFVRAASQFWWMILPGHVVANPEWSSRCFAGGMERADGSSVCVLSDRLYWQEKMAKLAESEVNNMLMQMRKNCNHPDLVTSQFTAGDCQTHILSVSHPLSLS